MGLPDEFFESPKQEKDRRATREGIREAHEGSDIFSDTYDEIAYGPDYVRDKAATREGVREALSGNDVVEDVLNDTHDEFAHPSDYVERKQYYREQFRTSSSDEERTGDGSDSSADSGNTEGEATRYSASDSGDLQNLRHLENIIAVCRNLPSVKFWLPTREYQTVEAYRRMGGGVPTNLCIRYSAHLVDGPPPLRYGLPVSIVCSGADQASADAHHCRARTRHNKCGRCRACWNPLVQIVVFPLK